MAGTEALCGTPANTVRSPEQLAAAVASWRRPYSPGPLTEAEFDQFYTLGWVIKRDIVPEELLNQAESAINSLVDEIAERLLAAGKIADAAREKGFHDRLIALEEQFPHAGVLLHKHGVLPTAFGDIWSHKNLLDMASQLLGPEEDIGGHPVWNLRCKTPERLSGGQATVPWHQDTSYLSEECWDKLQVTAWVPLVDATTANGCMQLVSGGHRTGITCEHTCCVGGTWYNDLDPKEMEATLGVDLDKDVVTCEVPRGSLLLLNNIIPHRSMENRSQGIRWSLDLRWQRHQDPNGFDSIKPNVLMRTGSDWSRPIQWSGWADAPRTAKQEGRVGEAVAQEVQRAAQAEGALHPVEGSLEELDTTISGPWMDRWRLVQHNRHTAARAAHLASRGSGTP